MSSSNDAKIDPDDIPEGFVIHHEAPLVFQYTAKSTGATKFFRENKEEDLRRDYCCFVHDKTNCPYFFWKVKIKSNAKSKDAPKANSEDKEKEKKPTAKLRMMPKGVLPHFHRDFCNLSQEDIDKYAKVRNKSQPVAGKDNQFVFDCRIFELLDRKKKPSTVVTGKPQLEEKVGISPADKLKVAAMIRKRVRPSNLRKKLASASEIPVLEVADHRFLLDNFELQLQKAHSDKMFRNYEETGAWKREETFPDNSLVLVPRISGLWRDMYWKKDVASVEDGNSFVSNPDNCYELAGPLSVFFDVCEKDTLEFPYVHWVPIPNSQSSFEKKLLVAKVFEDHIVLSMEKMSTTYKVTAYATETIDVVLPERVKEILIAERTELKGWKDVCDSVSSPQDEHFERIHSDFHKIFRPRH